jgi:hypothetical protein
MEPSKTPAFDKELSTHPYVADVIAPRHIDEMRRRIVAGQKLGSRQVDGNNVRELSRNE